MRKHSRLRKARLVAGYNTDEMAEILKMSKTSLLDIERNENYKRLRGWQVQLLTKLLDISLDELVDPNSIDQMIKEIEERYHAN